MDTGTSEPARERRGRIGTSAPPQPLLDGFDRPRDGFSAEIWDGDGFQRWSWDEWRAEASAMAAGLRAIGVGPGSRVACVLTNCPAACAAVPGAWLAGGSVLSLPTIARGMPADAYLAQLRRICAATDPVALLLEERFAAALPDDALPGVRVVSFESLPSARRVEAAPPSGEQLAFVQYSSGSTSEPRGCALSAAAVASQLRILAERLEVDPDRDAAICWLPLSHDMGLFGGVMLSFLRGMSLRLGTPQRFLRSPHSWFGDCEGFESTITAAPNFALELAVRAARVELPAAFPMKACVIGGERVEARSVASATAALAARGLSRRSLSPAYGMAEAVLAVTMVEVGESPTVLELDGAALLDGELVDAAPVEDWEADLPAGRTRLVSAGRPLSEVEVRVDGDSAVGELLVSSPSLASGYLADEAATRQRFRDGAVRTGDVGFLHEGDLYVVGRLDDMVTVGGRNIFARDVEVAMAGSVAVRPGSCVLVDLPEAGGRGRLLAMAEPADEGDDLAAVARSLAAAVRQATGFRLDQSLIVPPGTLPKTPSGKIQRFRCRQLLEAETIAPLARVGR